ncbi:hypothetical protein GCM10020367_20510 [Streptomyces sannanensis]|uniref:Uncharacterized protein n=1 Tax=Streptomyces sannanensis TaxID=285536 RepID=A0ABP6S968_9ACTN
MILTTSALGDTADAIARTLGPEWRILPPGGEDGTAMLIHDGDSAPMITLRTLFSGAVVQLALNCTGTAYNPNSQQWTEGTFYAWNMAVPLTSVDDDQDPADVIAERIQHDLLPAVDRKPRHVGDRPWETETDTPTVKAEPAPKPKARRARKKPAKTNA